MSKSKKRLLVRLSLVSLVVTLGVYALVQAQGRPQAADSQADETSTPSDESTAHDGPATNDQTHSLPSPSESVVRANDDGIPDPDGPAFLQIRDEGIPNKPPASVGSGGSFQSGNSSFRNEPPALPPAQPAEIVQSPRPPATMPPLTPALPNTQPASSPARLLDTQDEDRQAQPITPRSREFSRRDRDAVPAQAAPPRSGDPAPLRAATTNGFRAGDRYEDRVAANAQSLPPSGSEERAVAADHSPAASIAPRSFAVDEVAATGTPGPAQLEGVQTPSLALEKRAPAEIQVGKPAVFEIHVQNVGRAEAERVTVLDSVPEGTRFVDSTPKAERAADGSLVWRLGTMQAGDDKTISMQLLPQAEGEIGSVARVTFETQASVRTVCTKPQLTVELAAAPRVLIGESVEVDIRVSNPGTGAATGVILEEDVPEGLSHPAGNELEFEIGTLRPGESRDVKLTLKAAQAGVVENLVAVHGDGNLTAQNAVEVEVIAPQLSVATSGPSKRYLERRATYSIAVANPGTAPANNVELVAYLHKGMKFVESNNQGQYDPQTHAVFWSLEELPPQDKGTVQVTVIPVETGEQRLRVESRANLGLTDAADHVVSVEGLAALFFDVADLADPIEVGSNTTYQIRVINQGSKTDTNIQIVATLPPELEPIAGDGPTQHRITGQQVVFAPLSRLAPNGDAVFKIQARGIREADPRTGDPKIKVQLTSDESPTPVNKEESTRVYVDR